MYASDCKICGEMDGELFEIEEEEEANDLRVSVGDLVCRDCLGLGDEEESK